MSKKYRIREFADRIGRATSTVRRWEHEGKIVAKRHPSGQRYFDEEDVRGVLGNGYTSSLEMDTDVAQAIDVFCKAGRIAAKEWLEAKHRSCQKRASDYDSDTGA